MLAIDNLTKIYTFGYYIRSILEFSQYALISAVNEVYIWNPSQSLHTVSLIVALVLLILFLILIGFIVYLSLSSYKVIENSHNKLGELFNGIKDNKKHKIFVSVLLTRRLVFVATLISLVVISSPTLIISLSCVQLGYLIYATILRPYKQVKSNMIKILNEIYFLVLFSSLAYFNTEDKWSSIVTTTYFWIILSNSMISLMIILGKDILLIFRWCFNAHYEKDSIKMIETQGMNITLKDFRHQKQIQLKLHQKSKIKW